MYRLCNDNAGTGVPEMRAIRRQSTEIPDIFGVFIAQQQQPHNGLLITDLSKLFKRPVFWLQFPSLLRIGTPSYSGNV